MNEQSTADIRELTAEEMEAAAGGFLFLLVGAAAFGTGFLAGYGAVRLAQDLSD